MPTTKFRRATVSEGRDQNEVSSQGGDTVSGGQGGFTCVCNIPVPKLGDGFAGVDFTIVL